MLFLSHYSFAEKIEAVISNIALNEKMQQMLISSQTSIIEKTVNIIKQDNKETMDKFLLLQDRLANTSEGLTSKLLFNSGLH